MPGIKLHRTLYRINSQNLQYRTPGNILKNYFMLLLMGIVLWLPSCTYHTPLEGKRICIDPGHGGTVDVDSFRVGPKGEREEWINLRVALHLKTLLEQEGAYVLLTRNEDKKVDLQQRTQLAVENKAQVFISIHHNATADSQVNFPIIYYHGNASENRASVYLGQCVAEQFLLLPFRETGKISLVSDHTIFPGSGAAVLCNSYGIPGIIGEASFFTNPEEEKRLMDSTYNQSEAEAYFKALNEFFKSRSTIIQEKNSLVTIKPFPVLQEERRMNPVARLWQNDFLKAKQIFDTGDITRFQESYDLFSRSVHSFPDSYLAGEAHCYRSKILRIQSRPEEARMETERVEQHYVTLSGFQKK